MGKTLLQWLFVQQCKSIFIIIINIKDWTLLSVPSPKLQLLSPPSLRSSNCSPSLWSVVVWFQRDSVLWHSLQVSISYLLTPWRRILLEKLTGLQLVKKFPAFHGTRRFITALTSVRHLPLSWTSPIQSIYPHPTSWRSILILSTHLRLGLPSGLLPSGFPTKTLYTSLSSPIRATCPAPLTGNNR